MKRLCIFSALVFFCTLGGGYPTNEQLQSVYNTDIDVARGFVRGVKTAPPAGQTPLQQFNAQGFLLWDYLSGLTNAQMAQHFSDLTNLIINHNIKRVIVFIPTPSTYDYFDPTNTDDDHFIGMVTALHNNPNKPVGFSFAVFFDDQAFSSSATAGTVPVHNTFSYGSYFEDILPMLDWAKQVIFATPTGAISEIAFDPQPINSPGVSTKIAQQGLYNYTDEYKYLNEMGVGQTRVIKLGTTLGIDESKECYSNIFPLVPTIPTIYTGQITNFPTAAEVEEWRGASITDSLMQSVYIQCYQASIPALFALNGTVSNPGVTAGKYMLNTLRDQPYLTGEGTLSWTGKSTTITGQGVDFTQWSTRPGTTPPFPLLQTPLLFPWDTLLGKYWKAGEVSSIQSQTEVSLYTNVVQAPHPVPYMRTEIVTAWNTPSLLNNVAMTQSIINQIYWMFSRNYSPSDPSDPGNNLAFFGNWSLTDFMEFITTFVTDSSTNLPVFYTGDTSSTVLPISSNNMVIYQYDFLINNTTSPYTNWGLSID